MAVKLCLVRTRTRSIRTKIYPASAISKTRSHTPISLSAIIPNYDDPVDSEHFEDHVTHHYDFIGDKLIIGRICAIAEGMGFIMNGANHRMCSVTSCPFNIMGSGWEKSAPQLCGLPRKVTKLSAATCGSGRSVPCNPSQTHV